MRQASWVWSRASRLMWGLSLALLLVRDAGAQQPGGDAAKTPVQVDNELSTSKPDDTQVPEANPARPTVTNPAHIPPVGYVQFEQGVLFAAGSPGGVAHQSSVGQTTKLSVHPRLMLQVLSQPFAETRSLAEGVASSSGDAGDLLVGAQGLVVMESGLRPTVAIGYNRRVRAGSAADLDLGSYAQSVNVLVSGDVGKLHYDSNFGVAEQRDSAPSTVRRAQYNQSLSVTGDLLAERFDHHLELTGELWHVTQPLVGADREGRVSDRSNAVGALMALGYALRPNLVVDAGFDHGLTRTSTDWEGFGGVTFLLPHRLWPHAVEGGRVRRGHRHQR